MSRPGRDVLIRDGGPGVELAGHLLLQHEPTHPLNLLDLLFYNTEHFSVPKICILTSGLQVTSKRTKLYSAFWRENSRNHFNCSIVLAAPHRHGADSTNAFALLPSAAETTMVTNGGLVVIGSDRYHILQRVGGHWSPLIQIATNVCSRWEKSEFRL